MDRRNLLKSLLSAPLLVPLAKKDTDDLNHLEGKEVDIVQDVPKGTQFIGVFDVGEPITSMHVIPGIHNNRMFITHGSKVTEVVLDGWE